MKTHEQLIWYQCFSNCGTKAHSYWFIKRMQL